jgi:hypothetical protein
MLITLLCEWLQVCMAWCPSSPTSAASSPATTGLQLDPTVGSCAEPLWQYIQMIAGLYGLVPIIADIRGFFSHKTGAYRKLKHALYELLS